jgi:hypothetical protein
MKLLLTISIALFCVGCRDKPKPTPAQKVDPVAAFRRSHYYDSATNAFILAFVDTANAELVRFSTNSRSDQWQIYYPNLKIGVTHNKRKKYESLCMDEWQIGAVDSLGRTVVGNNDFLFDDTIWANEISDSAKSLIIHKYIKSGNQ